MPRHRRLISSVAFLMVLGILAVGCQKDGDPEAKGDKKKKKKTEAEKVEVKLTKIEAGELKKRIESEKGNVVVVDFWATS